MIDIEDVFDINNFSSFNDIISCKKKLEEEWFLNQKDINIVIKINYLNELIDDILYVRKSNREWLDIILSIVNKRNANYELKFLTGIRNNIRWNVYVIIKDKVDVNNIAKDEVSGIIFMAPDLYSEYYENDNFIVYSSFYGEDKFYLDKVCNIRKFFNKGRINGLKDNEIDELKDILFNEYKKEKKNEKIRRI